MAPSDLARIYGRMGVRAYRLAGRQAAVDQTRKALREIWRAPPDLPEPALEGYRDQLLKSFGWLLRDEEKKG